MSKGAIIGVVAVLLMSYSAGAVFMMGGDDDEKKTGPSVGPTPSDELTGCIQTAKTNYTGGICKGDIARTSAEWCCSEYGKTKGFQWVDRATVPCEGEWILLDEDARPFCDDGSGKCLKTQKTYAEGGRCSGDSNIKRATNCCSPQNTYKGYTWA
jgi:hypothetical protein